MAPAARASALAAVLLGMAAPAAHAQAANVLATATVGPALTMTSVRALDFGNVTGGVPRTVAATAATAGRWQLRGAGGANVRLVFTLPTVLASGPNTLPVGSWTGCRDFNGNVNNCVAFVPAGGAGNGLTLHPSGNLHVWIGGTVSPPTSTPGGLYTATIVLTASYL